jgi:hypothetical protein
MDLRSGQTQAGGLKQSSVAGRGQPTESIFSVTDVRCWQPLPDGMPKSTWPKCVCMSGSRPGTVAVVRRTKQKSGRPEGRPLVCLETCLDAYLFRKRRAIPNPPRAAPSNITVAPPSGTPTPPGQQNTDRCENAPEPLPGIARTKLPSPTPWSLMT